MNALEKELLYRARDIVNYLEQSEQKLPLELELMVNTFNACLIEYSMTKQNEKNVQNVQKTVVKRETKH